MLDEFRLPVCDLLGDAATTATLTELVSKPAFLLFQLRTLLLNVHQLTKIYSARTILASVHNIGTKTSDVTRLGNQSDSAELHHLYDIHGSISLEQRHVFIIALEIRQGRG